MAEEVRWILPQGLTANYSKLIVSRSNSENGPYVAAHQMDTVQNGIAITSWFDPAGQRNLFYIIDFLDPVTTQKFSDYALGFFPLTPKEKRLVQYITGWIPDIFKKDITEFDISLALKLALNHFNIYPPETNFNLASFPRSYEQYLIMGAQINLALLKYLKVSIRDFSYSDMGFSINIDRGTKIGKAAEDLNNIYNGTIERAKWNFIHQGLGMGSIPLNISIGGSLNRGLLNVLDIMNMQGR
jgi:hypothetical protein